LIVGLIVGLSTILTSNVLCADEGAPTGSFTTTVKPFLNTYCTKCHGADQQKGERRFDVLTGEIADDNSLVDLQDILGQLNLGEMPPKEAKQPPADERRRVTAWLTSRIERFHRERKPAAGETVLRRLNAREYRNTVRDLLHLNMTMFDPTAGFPRDQTSEHLDNVGETLVTSGYLLQKYLAAAEQIVGKALGPLEQPPVRTWKFNRNFRQQPEIDQVHGKTNGFSHITLYDVIGADKHEGAYGPIWDFKQGVPYDGYYVIHLKAEALNRINPYDPEFLGLDPDERLRLGIVAGNIEAGPLHKPQPIEPLLAELDLADESRWYTVRVWLDAGYTPRFTFRNGLMDARNLWARLLRKYPVQFPKLKTGGIVEHRFNAIKYGKLPQIHIHEVEIEGPYYDGWPTAPQRELLGDDFQRVASTGEFSDEAMRSHLTKFAARAYRRPATGEEIERLMQLIAARREGGRSPLEAYGDGLKAVLCSPAFLYLDEHGDGGQLSSYALATRLSYFLWSSMPDRRLLELAESDQLQQPEVLRAEVDRMLRDERSNALLDGFLDSWLTLRDLGSSPPDRSRFDAYYHYDLGTAMREETRLFARHLLDENLGIGNFLDSDFTFVNKPLARMYGVDVPAGNGFEKVTLKDRRRGGLLGQASVLTVTANGIDTSPVVRGVWLLENILGTPPSPPPPDVEPLDPDIRGATTIRDQLQRHRSTASCYDCHRKIDPLGFALENFDPIGNWRETYSGRVKIDASGELPSGQSFDDVKAFKRILLERQDQFSTALTSKLLAYAVGRRIEPSDRPHIDRIANDLADRGHGLRDLILLVATSEPFRAK
jgi:hypothetical protein